MRVSVLVKKTRKVRRRMKTEELIGKFVVGTVRSGTRFQGVVTGVDSTYLYLNYKGAKKFITISDIFLMHSEQTV